MADTKLQTRDLVRAYHAAWTGGEIDAAGQYLADDFTTRAPVAASSSQRFAAMKSRYVSTSPAARLVSLLAAPRHGIRRRLTVAYEQAVPAAKGLT